MRERSPLSPLSPSSGQESGDHPETHRHNIGTGAVSPGKSCPGIRHVSATCQPRRYFGLRSFRLQIPGEKPMSGGRGDVFPGVTCPGYITHCCHVLHLSWSPGQGPNSACTHIYLPRHVRIQAQTWIDFQLQMPCISL
jgi:hypothetical protein